MDKYGSGCKIFGQRCSFFYPDALYYIIIPGYPNWLVMSRPLVAQINLAALQYNYALMKAQVSPAKGFAVIKANAYGHGVLPVARALQNIHADGFALLEIEYACLLREEGIRAPILLLEGVFDKAELALCIKYNLMIVVHNLAQLAWLEKLPAGSELDVFLKLNSGMNRLGFTPEMIVDAVKRLRVLPAVKCISLMTHFATADEPDKGITAQWSHFSAVCRQYPDLAVTAANSAAIFRHPETHGQWVRAGLMLYGASPFAKVSAKALGLRPVMCLRSRIIAIQDIRRHDIVGYGAMFVADRAMRIAVIACGYADGYPRHAPNGTPVWVAGVCCPLVGRVSMDMLCVDISNAPQAVVGSPAELWGNTIDIDEVARRAGTISYELMCAVAARVKMEYPDHGEYPDSGDGK